MQNEDTPTVEIETAGPPPEETEVEATSEEAPAEPPPEPDGNPSQPMALRERLHAWWEGVDPVPAEETDSADARRDAPEPEPSAEEQATATAARAEVDEAAWSEDRIAVSELAWGEGHTRPGDREFMQKTAQQLNLDSSASMLDLSAALGSNAREMAESFGVWVAALDPSTKLTEKSAEKSAEAGLSELVPVANYDPETVELPEDSYDCVVARDVLFTTKNKERLFETIAEALKTDGELVITDYMLARTGADSDALRDWTASEPLRPYLWSVEEFVAILLQLKLDIHLKEDLTERYRGLIVAGLEELMAKCEDHEKLDKQAGDALLNEVELWARRKAVLESGDVKVVRIYARKLDLDKNGPLRTMGDW